MYRFLLLFVLSAHATISAERLSADRLFQRDHIVQVRIELPEEKWAALCLQTRTMGEALSKTLPEKPFTYMKGHITIDGVRIENVGIRKKGFIGSLDSTRPSLKVKFNEYRKKQHPIDDLDRLTLNNNKQDTAHLSQYLGYQLFQESKTPAPRCNHAHVTVNGQNLGIYSNVESIRKPFLKRTFGSDEGDLFEGTIADFMDGWMHKFESKRKRTKVVALKPLHDVLKNPESTLKEIGEILDIDAFIRFWAMESLISFWDGYTNNQNNYFLYQNPSTSKWQFIPWGLDSAFTSMMPFPPFFIPNHAAQSQSVISNRLYHFPEIQDKYLTTMKAILDAHWKESVLNAEIDAVTERLKDLHTRGRSQEKGLKKLRTFINMRRTAIENAFKIWPLKIPDSPKEPVYFSKIGSAKVTFDTHWYDKSPRNTQKIGEIDLSMTLHDEPIEFEAVGVIAERGKMPGSDGEYPASVVIHAKRKSDGAKIVLGIGLEDVLFRPSTSTIAAQGIIMGGVKGFGVLSSEIKFSQAATKDEAQVSGEATISILQMRGGKPIGKKEG
ncbi:CotH kinase family protein [bacterium]|jgi:hypothetical protein|nr:CotH kinase family protein [Verrucomicrobiales bacterium]MDC0503569.1 CotH kinase family protein [Verrucomicrobiales bacterium]MDC3255014.1 CotH kinase family protein [bacterium]MDF1785487.1 CotH kinase family protein [Verrucomicrobiales bacterium]